MREAQEMQQVQPMQRASAAALADDAALLTLMLKDAAAQKALYRPGPYWRRKAGNTADQIRRQGIGDFRGASSTIGVSFTDAVYVDVRHDLCGGLRSALRLMLNSVFPFNRVFDTQVALTRSHEAEARRLRGVLLGASDRVRDLVRRYTVPPSLLGGCLDYVEVDGRRIANIYLQILHKHDVIAADGRFSDVSSMLEIGGGFGAHVHCLIENYPQLRKIVYLDIPPNLYVGTQYLRAIYGAAVVDYRQTRALPEIAFSADDKLEILAIAPWQIERLRLSIDLLYNEQSFVEMPAPVVANYARHVAALRGFERTRIVMLTYTGFDLRTSLHPDRLPEFFPTKTFDRREFSMPDGSFGVFAFVSRDQASHFEEKRA
jgi:putative sugar O-methyltransferase